MISIIQLFLFSLLAIIFFFLAGTVFTHILYKNTVKNYLYSNIYLQIFIGIIFVSIFSVIINFIYPLDRKINSIIFIVILIIGFYFFSSELKKNNFLKFGLIAFISTILLYKSKLFLPDAGLYHLPFIKIINSEKIIFGLSNLQPQFGWNSSWLNLSAMFYLPILGLNGVHMSNPILFFFVLCLFIETAYSKKNENRLSRYFLIILSFYIIIKFSRISAHGFDFPANIFLLLSFYYFLKLNETYDNFKLEKYFIIILIFSTLALTIKLSTFMAPLIVFASLFIIKVKNIKKKNYN